MRAVAARVPVRKREAAHVFQMRCREYLINIGTAVVAHQGNLICQLRF